jgi:hypothetical protein
MSLPIYDGGRLVGGNVEDAIVGDAGQVKLRLRGYARIATPCTWAHQRRPQRTPRGRTSRRIAAKSGSRGDPDSPGDDPPPAPLAAAVGRGDDSGLNRVLRAAFGELERPVEFYEAAAILERRGDWIGGVR